MMEARSFIALLQGCTARYLSTFIVLLSITVLCVMFLLILIGTTSDWVRTEEEYRLRQAESFTRLYHFLVRSGLNMTRSDFSYALEGWKRP